MPDRRAVINKNVLSQLISDVILASLLNKLPYEHEFRESCQHFSAQVRAEIIHFCVGVLLHVLFFNLVHHFETSPVTCEAKNLASVVRAVEKWSV